MNHNDTTTAITVVIAIALSAAAFTLPTRHALAWGVHFGNSIIVDQRIHQLNECSSPPDNAYKQSSYDLGNNKSRTVSTGSIGTHFTFNNQAGSNNGEDGSDNKQPQPNDSGGGSDYINNNKPSKGSTLCFNSGSNAANIG